MAQYIPKSALVAEIERRLDELYDLLPDASKVENGNITISEACNTGKYTALESFRRFLDTLEVTEVGVDLGDPKGDKSAKYIIDTKTLKVKEVDIEEKAVQLSQKYFPDEENIWARANIEAQRCKSACIEMVEWFKEQKGQ